MTPETMRVFQQLNNALLQLENATQISVSASRLEIDGTIQRFEFTFELFWKALKKKLFDDFSIEALGNKNVLQQAYAMKLINNETMWLAMITDRNLTSHTYKQNLADQIYQNIKKYAPFLRQELHNIMKAYSKIPTILKS